MVFPGILGSTIFYIIHFYKQVMICRYMPERIYLKTLKKGAGLYLKYLEKDNAITEYIKQLKG